KKYIAYMGGEQAAMALAQQDYARGEFRWVAELANHLVFANPQCTEARQLGANALEQMGYQAESATWRNSFILGAQELRYGVANPLASRNGISIEMLSVLPVPRLLDALAIRLDGLKVQDLELRLDWQMAGEEGRHRITISNGAMSHQPGSHGINADATVHICRVALDKLLREKKGLLQGLTRGEIQVQGAQAQVRQLFGNLDDFDPMFNILEP
ncbi:MAG: alkyl sulfatase dimerization domain-containing protein, partial [Comamonas sp.]